MIYLLLLLFLLPVMPAAWAVDPPAGTGVEVLEKKIREESQEEILQQEEPAPAEIEHEKPKEGAAPEDRFFAEEITLEGDTLQLEEKLRPLLSQLEQKEITFAELKELQKKIEQLYRAEGYLAVAYVPPQKIQGGKVKLHVQIYRMGKLYIEGNKYSWGWKVRSYWDLKSGDYLRYDRMQRSLMRMNQRQDRTAKSYLEAAPEQGVLDVHIKLEDHLPIHGGYSLDNQGTKLTGKHRHGLTLRDNSLLGFDDVFLIGTSFGDDYGSLFLQHLIPVNSHGTRFLWGFSHAQVDPRKEFDAFGINGISQTFSLSVRQELYRNERTLIDSYISYNFKEKRTQQLSVTSVWDQLRVLSFGVMAQRIDPRGLWSMGQNFFWGLPFRGDGYPLNSRGGETSFFKYGTELKRIQKLPWDTRGLLQFEAQVSENKLMPEEQIFLGGMDTVRGYADNDYGADAGLFARAEYQIPFYIVPEDWKMPYGEKSLRESIEVFGFTDYGFGILRDPGTEEHRERNLLGVGAGFRMQFRKNLSAEFAWGVPLGDPGLIESAPSQFHFRFNADV